MITKVNHVSIFVLDQDSAYDFYVNKLGFKVNTDAQMRDYSNLIAEGMADDLLDWRAPYDLLIANILAGPLIELAPDFAAATSPRASIVLSGLLVKQEPAVRAAYRACGFRLHRRLHQGDWSILWLRRRFAG